MKAIFYTTYDSNNVIGKKLENEIEYDVKIKKSTDITKPVILLKCDNIPRYNYCYIENWNRYYFINNIEVTPNNIFEISMTCDVLESYKNEILKCSGYIKQQKQNINVYYGEEYPVEVRKETDIYKSNITIDDSGTVLLTTIGG